MKKIVAMMLALAMCLSLCACGGNPYAEVEEALQGEWTYTHRYGDSVYTFNDGTVVCKGNTLGVEHTSAGTYEIGDHAIHITYENGIEAVFEYIYENGELSLKASDAWDGNN